MEHVKYGVLDRLGDTDRDLGAKQRTPFHLRREVSHATC